MLSLLAFAVPLLLGVSAAPYQQQPANGTISWGPCPQNGTLPYTCGTLTVLLDYTSPDLTRTLDLSLIKVSAAKQPKKGSILFNPGGPGLGGRAFVAENAENLLISTGGVFDLIGFDPRQVFLQQLSRISKASGARKIPIFIKNREDTIKLVFCNRRN